MSKSSYTRRAFLHMALVSGLGAAGLSVACSGPAAPTGSQPRDAGSSEPSTGLSNPITVSAGSTFSLAIAPAIVGFEQGYFQQAGINIDFQRFDTIANMIPLLGTGQLDVAFDGASSAGFFNAFSRGIGIKMVANQAVAVASNEEHPYYGIVVAKQLVDDGRVKRVADLKGMPVNVVSEGVLAQLMWGAALEAEGLTLSDVQQETMSFPDSVTAMQNGSIAAGFLVEPFITVGEQQGAIEVLLAGERIAPNREITVVFFSPAFAEKQQAADEFVTAYLRGARDYVRAFFGTGGERATAVSQLVKHLAVKEPALYDRMGMPYVNPDGKINVADLQAQQDWYVAQGQVAQPISIADAIDSRFVEAALGRLGPFSG